LKDKEEFGKGNLTRITKRVSNIVENLHSADNGLIKKDTAWNLFNSIQGAYQHNPSQSPKDLDQSILD
jgi:hypothetical protein